MKKVLTMLVVAMMAVSFSMVAFAAEEKAAAKSEQKNDKKEKKDTKKDEKKKEEAKPAAKGKKEVSGC